MNDSTGKGSEHFRVWVRDFDTWPERWKGTRKSLDWGRKLLPIFSGFLQSLHAEGMDRKTFERYRDSLWILGGSIVREVVLNGEYLKDPLEKLTEAVEDDGMLPDHYDDMSRAELRAFERMCRRFEKWLRKTVSQRIRR